MSRTEGALPIAITGRGAEYLKRIISALIMGAALSCFTGCDKADRVLEAADKAIAVKEDVDRKVKQFKEKAESLMPGESLSNKDKKEKQGSERKNRGELDKDD